MQQVCKLLSDTNNSAGCKKAEVEESSEWSSTVNSEENRANFVKV
jgi:hypothetical protein